MKISAAILVARAVLTDHTNYGVTRTSSEVQKSFIHVFVPRVIAVAMFVALHRTATDFYPAIFSNRIKVALNSSDKSMRTTRVRRTGGSCVRQKVRPDAVFGSAITSRTKVTAKMMNAVRLTFSENTDPPEH